MTLKFLQENAIGADLEVIATDRDGVVIDISSATDLVIRLKDPSGETFDYTGEFTTDGEDGKFRYRTENASDLDGVGTWKYQGWLVLGDYDGPTEELEFYVKPNLQAPSP